MTSAKASRTAGSAPAYLTTIDELAQRAKSCTCTWERPASNAAKAAPLLQECNAYSDKSIPTASMSFLHADLIVEFVTFDEGMELMIGAKRNETHQIAMMMFIRLRTIYS
jgi:hypothetical protein